MSDVQDNLTVGKLRRMSHVQLQSVAKQLNIKANIKTVKLRDAILDKIMMYGNAEGSDAETSEIVYTPSQDEPQMGEKAVGSVCETGEDTKLRRRSYDVTSVDESSSTVQSAVTPPNPKKVSSPDETVFMTAHVIHKASDKDETIFLSAKSKKITPRVKTPKTVRNKMTASGKTPKTGDRSTSSAKTPKTGDRMTPRAKTPKAKRDQSVGMTPPVRRIYNLRSNRNDVESMKSLIPRPVNNVRKIAKGTPKFARIHQRAFDKMESIDVTVKKRRKLHEARMSRPKLTENTDSVFRPTILTTKRLDLNFANMKQVVPKAPAVADAMNKTFVYAAAPQPPKPVFNLAESLAKKLRYKPHTGPLQPLSENTKPDVVPCGHIKISSHNVNTVKDKYRTENTTFLKGVRRNRRLDLQLKLRGIIE